MSSRAFCKLQKITKCFKTWWDKISSDPVLSEHAQMCQLMRQKCEPSYHNCTAHISAWDNRETSDNIRLCKYLFFPRSCNPRYLNFTTACLLGAHMCYSLPSPLLEADPIDFTEQSTATTHPLCSLLTWRKVCYWSCSLQNCRWITWTEIFQCLFPHLFLKFSIKYTEINTKIL